MSASESVVWHDLECGAYRADLPLWLELAADAEGEILDVGAGTGRVALQLARAGHRVTALDTDADLLAALKRRAGSLAVHTVRADARSFVLPRRYGLIVAAMQVVQLLGATQGRASFLRCARAALAPGGLLACALVEDLVPFESSEVELRPEVLRHDSCVFSSHPVAIRRDGPRLVLERRHVIADTDAPAARETLDRIALDCLDACTLEAEALAAGLQPGRARTVAPTRDHVGSVVVMLHG